MPMHTGPRRSSKTNTNGNGNELETLYRQQLPTLRELFPGWNREDLVAAMNEANGDLDLTIDRITAGHTNQWDQVKSKKFKSPASPTGATQNTNTRKLGDHGSARGVRNGKSRHAKSRRKSGDKAQRKTKEDEGPLEHVDQEKEKKPSWASILKGPTKVELAPSEPTTTPIPDNSPTEKAIAPDSTDDHDATENSLSTNQQIPNVSGSADPIVEQADDLAKNKDSSHETDNANENDETSIQMTSDPVDTITTTTSETIVTSAAEQVETQDLQQFVGFRKVPVRRLKQEEPVILPGGGNSLENVSLQFGSLNLTNGEEQSIKGNKQGEQQQKVQDTTKPTVINTPITPMPTDAATTHTSLNAPSCPNGPASLSETNTQMHQPQPQSQFNQNFTSQPTSQPQQPQIQQYQPQEQRNSVPITNTSMCPYASYIPTALPPGNGQLQEFANPAMGTLPSHYSREGQKSINYDNPSVYTQSTSINNAQLYSRGKYSNLQEEIAPSSTACSITTSSITTSTVQMPQPTQTGTYGANATSYDSYYYMPNHYQNYQHIGYQTPPTLQQQQQPQPHQYSKQIQSSYVYPTYGKQNHSVYQNYTNQQPYDASMLHSNRSEGLMYDKQQYQSSSNLPQIQHYFDQNSSQIQQQAHHTEIIHGGQPNAAMVIEYEKQQGLSMPQPMATNGSNQPHYQQYNQQHHQPMHQQHHQPMHQQQQPTFHYHQSYNTITPNNSINAYSTWQNQPQQPLFWQHA